MHKKVDLWIVALTMLVAFVLIIMTAVLVRQELVGERKLGVISKSALFLGEIPSIIKRSLKPASIDLSLPDTSPGQQGFLGIPNDYPSYLLLSRYDGDLKQSVVELINLTTFAKVHTWNPDIDAINQIIDTHNIEFANTIRDNNDERYRIIHPFLDQNGSLIFQNFGPMIKIDVDSELVWLNQTERFHHSIERDASGSFWAPVHLFPYQIDTKYAGSGFDNLYDDGIALVTDDGELVFSKSVSNILIENGLGHLIYGLEGMLEARTSKVYDPIHLNDIEPVLFSSDWFEKGDLFLSLRHQSMILLYRPSTNKIIWHKSGPWSHQHDVDVLDDNKISIFDNRARNSFNESLNEGEFLDGNNQVVIYDFASNKLSSLFNDSLATEDISTIRGGRQQITETGDLFVESDDQGKAVYFRSDGQKLWSYVNRAPKDGRLYRTNWSRIITETSKVEEIETWLANKN